MEKAALDRMLRRLRVGGVAIKYWDGEARQYGPEEPYLTIHIKNRRVAWAMARDLSLGVGEAYMNGDIEVDGPLVNLTRLGAENAAAFAGLANLRLPVKMERNVKANQMRQVQHHYDLGDDFYKLWLDESMTYSCAYFKKPTDSLEQAQINKIDHLLRKLQLEPGMRLLDIGCGWGQLMITAAKNYGAHGLGITLSQHQYETAKKRAKAAGVDKQVDFELINYRDLASRGLKFDRVISVGMFEHVGRRNHASYFEAVSSILPNGGISVLHSISNQVEKPNDPWIDRYIFPGGNIPSSREVVAHLPKHGLRLTDYENLRIHYAMTLEEWSRRFEQHTTKIAKMYDERFVRMWRFYLAGATSGFRYGDLDLSQFVMTKGLNNDLPLTREFLYQTTPGK